MKKKLVIYGAGDNGVQLALDIQKGRKLTGYEFTGFVDDHKVGSVGGMKILGGKESLKELISRGHNNIVVFLLDNPVKRLEVCSSIEKLGFNFPSIYSKDSLTDNPNLQIGKGVYIHDTSVFLGYDQKVGDFSVIGPHTTLEGRVSIGKGTVICPYGFVGYQVDIGNACLLGVRSSILPKVNLGDRVTIGPHVLQRKNLENDGKNLRHY